MAKVIWKEKATQLLERHLDYALAEFGRKTVEKWYKEITRIENRMEVHPESFTPENSLKQVKHTYRGAILMKNFKLIHYYDSKDDCVYIVTVWDMRMHPGKLKKMVK